MTQIQLQFHGEASEMIRLATGWARSNGFLVAAEQFFPDYRIFEFASLDGMGKVPGFPQISRLTLGTRDFDLDVRAPHQFVTRNDDCLFISLEWPTNEGLREGAMEGKTNDADLARVWRRLIRQAKKVMHKGAVVRGRNSGVTQALPSHLHTVGAHRLAENGIRMLAAAGGNEYIFDDVTLPPATGSGGLSPRVGAASPAPGAGD